MNIFIVALVLIAAVAASILYRKRNSSTPRSSRQTTIKLKGAGKYEYVVVGVARFRSALGEICDVAQREAKIVEAVLVPDDGGRHRKAVRVDIRGQTVGYLPPELAEAYRKRLVDSGYPGAHSICSAQISARLHSAGGDPDYSVRLDLPQKR